MSLGWQTESALLPSKAKPITVDDKSMFSLKAIISREEQKREQLSINKGLQKIVVKSKSDSNKAAVDKVRSGAACKNEDTVVAEDAAAFARLRAKAKIYEDMVAGKIACDDTLVSFDSKKPLSSEHDEKSTKSIAALPLKHHIENTLLANDAQLSGNRLVSSSDYASSNISNGKSEVDGIYLNTSLHSSISESQPPVTSMVFNSARIRTQWEKTLSNSSRAFVDEIHAQTNAVRSGGSGSSNNSSAAASCESSLASCTAVGGGVESRKRSLKEDRLNMIKAKQQRLQALDD
jgi:hypothetical protein